MDKNVIDEFFDAGLIVPTGDGNYEVTELGERFFYFMNELKGQIQPQNLN